MSLIEIKSHLTARERIVFSIAWLVLCGVLAVSQWSSDRSIVAAVLVALGVALPLAGLVHGRLVDRVYQTLAWITSPLGWLVSHLVLGAIFFGVITPIGLFRRLLGHDPMRRKFESERESYWEPIEPKGDRKSYLKPF